MTDNIRHLPTARRDQKWSPGPTPEQRLLGHVEPGFEIIDANRDYDPLGLARVVMDVFGWAEPLDARVDTWKSLPIRLIHDSAGGWQIELGPYNLDAADILNLKEAIAAYDKAVGR